jgi:hypothetical protein
MPIILFFNYKYINSCNVFVKNSLLMPAKNDNRLTKRVESVILLKKDKIKHAI